MRLHDDHAQSGQRQHRDRPGHQRHATRLEGAQMADQPRGMLDRDHAPQPVRGDDGGQHGNDVARPTYRMGPAALDIREGQVGCGDGRDGMLGYAVGRRVDGLPDVAADRLLHGTLQTLPHADILAHIPPLPVRRYAVTASHHTATYRQNRGGQCKRPRTIPRPFKWSGRRESNPRNQFGRLRLYH